MVIFTIVLCFTDSFNMISRGYSISFSELRLSGDGFGWLSRQILARLWDSKIDGPLV